MATSHSRTKSPAHEPQTIDETREAFLAQRRQVGPVFVEPLSLGILWLMDILKHPLNEKREPLLDAAGEKVPLRDAKGVAMLDEQGQPLYQAAPIGLRDTARAICVFHDSKRAFEALSNGLEALDAEAINLVRTIGAEWLPKINTEIARTYSEGLATIVAGGKGKTATGD